MCREKVMFSVKPERMGAPCHLLPGATQSRASVKPRRGLVWLLPLYWLHSLCDFGQVTPCLSASVSLSVKGLG